MTGKWKGKKDFQTKSIMGKKSIIETDKTYFRPLEVDTPG